MKRIAGLNDLRAYGIEPLTGESCGLGLRILCDVNEKGRKLFATAFGLPPDVKLAENWNSRVNGQPAIGSIMLGREDYKTIGVFALLEAGCVAVYRFVPSHNVFESNKRLVVALREQRMLMPPDNTTAAPLIENVWLECVRKLSDHALAVTPFGTMFSEDTLMGIEVDDAEYLEQYLAHAKRDGWDFFCHRVHGTAGYRNVHQMSGRAE